jgi:signal transduction histidine kinase
MQKENIILVIVVVGFFLAVSIIVFIAAMLVTYYKKELNFKRQFEEAESKFRQELLQSKLDIQEQTISDISRDMHDNLGQIFTLVKLHLHNMEVRGKAEEIRLMALDCVSKGIDDMRDLSKSFSLELIKNNGLAFAIEKLIEQIRRINNFKIQFETFGSYEILDEQQEIFLFRILQEAFSNIIRHAGASEVLVLIDSSASDSLKLVVKDNGRGFRTKTLITTNTKSGLGGLNHMVNRVKLIEGEISIESYPGAGTIVNITIPYTRVHAEVENFNSVGR